MTTVPRLTTAPQPACVLIGEGDLLAGRYRLQRPLTPPGSEVVGWLAYDETLARPVALRAVAALDPRAASLLAAAVRVAAVEAPGLARIFDAATESLPDRARVAYTLREWVEGQPVDDVVGNDPLIPALALALALDATAGLVALHAAGLVHGSVHPGNVLVDELGRARLSDAGLGLATGLRNTGPAGSPGARPGGGSLGARPGGGSLGARPGGGRQHDQERDVRDLACVLHALVTARWPVGATAQQGGRLPDGPPEYASPRQVRAGVPRAVDAVVLRALEPGRRPGEPSIRTAPQLLAALESAADEVGRELRAAAPKDPRQRGIGRRLAPYALVVALLGAVGVVAYGAGLQVGEIPALSTEQSFDASPPVDPGTSSELPAPARIDLTGATVTDFDPDGDGRENRAAVAAAFDGEVSTAWRTEAYRTAAFGGLKPGVGLLVALGRPTAVSRVELDATAPGGRWTLRAGDTLGSDEQALPEVAAADASDGSVTLVPSTPTVARYWLVWITSLPADGGTFRAGIDELAFFRP